MRRRALFAAFLIVAAAPSAARAGIEAAQRFEGRVVNASNGAPAASATVSIAFHPGAARTEGWIEARIGVQGPIGADQGNPGRTVARGLLDVIAAPPKA